MSNLASRVALLLFASGFCSLVYQMCWLRLLRLVFGASTAASAAVLAIFMGGLGVGSLLLGPRADRSRNPLALYAHLEIGIALAAAASPALIAAVRWSYISLGGTETLGSFGGTAVRLALSALVLAVPTFLMGGTLPATVRAVTRAEDVGRRTVGLLYAVNTLGAVVGVAITVFWAIELQGITRTVIVAALINLLVAMSARALSRRWEAAPARAVAGAEGSGGSEASESSRGAASSPAPLGFVLAAAAVVGFAFFLMELVWYRMLGPILGGTSYTFGAILAVALVGIGLGGLVYASGSRARRPSLVGFGATCAIEALLLIVPFALGDRIALLALTLQGLDAAGFGGLVVEWTLVTALVVLPPALVAGYQFPLLVGIVGAAGRQVGREVGLTYAWNTVGAIAGAVAGGFGILPLVTAPGTWRWTAVGLAGLAIVAVLLARPRGARWRLAAPVLAVALAALGLTTADGPSAFWRHEEIGGRRARTTFEGPNDLRAEMRAANGRLIWEAEGRESSVALIHGNGFTFLVNGKTDGSALQDAPTQVMGGLVGSMLHPAPRTALVIGLGTGSTAGWLAGVPGMERVDVVELEPSMTRVAEACSGVNRDVLGQENVHLVFGDGRELLLTTDRRYDVIFSEPSNPYRAGISSLFTREFYEAAVDRLTEDGVFLQWLQGYETDAEVVRTAYATLGSVFPAVESWQVQTVDLLLVAGRRPVVHDWQRTARRAAEEPYRSALARVWGVRGAAGFYSGFLGGPGLAGTMAEAEKAIGGRLNTDDHPVIEYGFARNLGRAGLFEINDLATLARQGGWDRPHFGGNVPSSVGWRSVMEAKAARDIFFRRVGSAAARNGDDEEQSWLLRQTLARGAYVRGDLSAVFQQWMGPELPKTPGAGTLEPTHPADLLMIAEALADRADERSLELADRLEPWLPNEAEVVRARFLWRRGAWEEATSALEELFRRLHQEPWLVSGIHERTLQVAEAVGTHDPALARRLLAATAEPFSSGVLELPRRLLRTRLAQAAGFAAHCVDAFAPFEPDMPWQGAILRSRVRCYQETNNPLLGRAVEELATWQAAEPPRLDAGL